MKATFVIAALSATAIGVGGALAEEPPPVIAPAPAPVPAQEAPADDCDATLPQVLAELDYWRTRATGPTEPTATEPTATEPTEPTAAQPTGPTATEPTAAVPPLIAPAPTPATTPATTPPPTPTGLALGPSATGPTPALDRPRIDQVAAALKEMKPKDAAAVFASWDDALAIAVLEQLSGRAVSAIATALPPDHAARLLAKLSLAPRNAP